MRRRLAFTLIELLVVIAIIALLISILIPALNSARFSAKKAKCQANLRTIGHAVQFYLGDNRDIFPDVGFYGCLGYIGRSQNLAILGTQVPEDQRPLNRYLNVDRNPLDPNASQTRDRYNEVIRCPGDRGDAYFPDLQEPFFVEHGTSYTYASDFPYVPTFDVQSCRGVRLVEIKYAGKKIVFQEPVFNPSFNPNDPRAQWHYVGRNHSNLLYADLHVAFTLHAITNLNDPNDPNNLPDPNRPYY